MNQELRTVAVEWDADDQERLHASYAAFRAGDKKLTADENHQIVFRLGRRLGHEPLWAVDADARGAGHVPILRHAAEASPAVRLVEVAEVLE